jgi:hypothetical protein
MMLLAALRHVLTDSLLAEARALEALDLTLINDSAGHRRLQAAILFHSDIQSSIA